MVWFELAVDIPVACSDAVANFLIENGAPGLQLDERGDVVRLVAHYAAAPPLAPLRRFCADIGASLDSTAVRVREVADEDWAENWKLYFHPQFVGERLYVCPPWDSAAPPGRIAVVIEPGMAFGTGQHATTRGCLSAIDWAVGDRSIQRALDVGTGSGILAIALAKLGVPEVWAVDLDPQALVIAGANVASNRVGEQIHLTSDIEAFPGRADLVAANLYANLLLEFAAELTQLVASHGIVICSGFLCDDEQSVRSTYEALGSHVVDRHEESGWVTLAFQRPAQT